MPTAERNFKTLAKRADLSISPYVRKAVTLATAVGFRAMMNAISAMKAGRDPGLAARSTFEGVVPLLRDTVVVAYLEGWRAEMEAAGFEFAHAAAIAFLTKRLNMSVGDLGAVADVSHAQSLKILDGASAHAEKKIQRAVLKATREGMHVREGVKELRKAFTAAGITPSSSFQLENIFRTQTQMAYGAGRWAADQSPEVREILWGYRYVTVGDDRVRPEHDGLDGFQAPKDDPIWSTYWPPNGWACRCIAISLFEDSQHIPPPSTTKVAGRTVATGPDVGFSFNPGRVFESSTRALKPNTRATKATLDLHARVGTLYKDATGPGTSDSVYDKARTARARKVKSHPKQFGGDVDLHKIEMKTHGFGSKTKVAGDRATAIVNEELNGMLSRSDTLKRLYDDIPIDKRMQSITVRRSDIHIMNTAGKRTGGKASGMYTKDRHLHVVAQKSQVSAADRITIGKWNTTPSFRGTTRHEFGHFIHDNALTDEMQKQWLYAHPGRDAVRKTIGKYAATGGDEAFAEAFSVWMHPKYRVGTLPKWAETYFRKYLPRKGMKRIAVKTVVKKKVAAKKLKDVPGRWQTTSDNKVARGLAREVNEFENQLRSGERLTDFRYKYYQGRLKRLNEMIKDNPKVWSKIGKVAPIPQPSSIAYKVVKRPPARWKPKKINLKTNAALRNDVERLQKLEDKLIKNGKLVGDDIRAYKEALREIKDWPADMFETVGSKVGLMTKTGGLDKAKVAKAVKKALKAPSPPSPPVAPAPKPKLVTKAKGSRPKMKKDDYKVADWTKTLNEEKLIEMIPEYGNTGYGKMAERKLKMTHGEKPQVKKWLKGLKPNEQAAIDAYTELSQLQYADDIKAFNTALDRAPGAHGRFYRGLNNLMPEEIESLKEGAMWRAGDHQSLSRSKQVSNFFTHLGQGGDKTGSVILEFDMAGGAVDIRAASLYTHQEEFILRRQAKFRVKKVIAASKDPNGITHVILEEIK